MRLEWEIGEAGGGGMDGLRPAAAGFQIRRGDGDGLAGWAGLGRDRWECSGVYIECILQD